MKENQKNFFIGLGIILFYFLATYFVAVPLAIVTLPLNIDMADIPTVIKNIYLFCYQGLMIFGIWMVLKKKLEKDYLDLKQNHQLYFRKYFKYWFLLIALVELSSIFISIVSHGTSVAGNQEAINETLKVYPLYMYLSATLIAPFLEEFTFRQAIHYVFKNKYIFIFASGLLFGLIHVIGNVESVYDWLYILPYGIPGCIFAYILTKTDNIFTTVFMHMFHNAISLSISILIMIFF